MTKFLNILLVLTLTNGCYSQQDSKKMIVRYEAFTRGSSVEIKATSELITYKDTSVEKEIIPSAEEWNAFIQLIKDFDLSEIKDFHPPSNKSQVDAALQATLSISVDGTTYQSQAFDDGNPPVELKKIINKLFELISE